LWLATIFKGAIAKASDSMNTPTSLDVTTQSVEEYLGKIVEINKSIYQLAELMGGGGEAYVFRLVNVRTGVSEFVIKVHRFLPGSPEYTELLKTRAQTMFFLASVSVGADDGFEVMPIEIYEQNGGLIGFQRLVRGVTLSDLTQPVNTHANVDPETEALSEVDRLIRERNFDASAAIIKGILRSNPKDTRAMKRSATCYWHDGDHVRAMHLLQSALELEPNDTEIYRQLASYYVAIGWSDQAVGLLAETLSRYSMDFNSWYRLLQIAIEYDLVDEVIDFVEDGLEIIGAVELGKTLITDIERSRQRNASYSDLMSKASEAQHKGDWDRAIRCCKQAISLSKRNITARLNELICHFQLGDNNVVLQDGPQMLYQLRGMRALSAVVVLMMAACKNGHWSLAKEMSFIIGQLAAENFVDLPTTPIVAREDAVEEKGDAQIISGYIDSIADNTELSADERSNLTILQDLYRKLAEAITAADRQQLVDKANPPDSPPFR
jgi:tetratricopeptide (TPR) repeat protein